MKRIAYLFFLFLILPLSASAVTDQEMEQARTIATQAYLRYANDGSGYLDQLKPKTMAELEKNLKQKEKENIKAFKAIPVPSDFASWDKQKLVEYWGGTAFSTKGLIEKGRLGRNRAKKNINAMNVTDPQQSITSETKDSGKEIKATDATSAKDTTATSTESTAIDSTELAIIPTETETTDSSEDIDSGSQIKKANNHTWIYFVILCVLVGVVVALVVFASNVMKKNEAVQTEQRNGASPTTTPSDGGADINVLREKFAATLTAKNEEIHSLSKKLEGLNSQNQTLKANLENLTAEAASLRSRLGEAARKIAEFEASASLSGQTHDTAGAPLEVTPTQHNPASPQHKAQTVQTTRTIYLGRANAKGIFVRADRTLNLGNSIFRLDTTDGYAGSFRVANDPTVWEMALLSPQESLAQACVAANIDNTDGMHKIVNDSAGTAIFEGGCWKVIRKAKIHYE